MLLQEPSNKIYCTSVCNAELQLIHLFHSQLYIAWKEYEEPVQEIEHLLPQVKHSATLTSQVWLSLHFTLSKDTKIFWI